MTSAKTWYQRVNDTWPSQVPALTFYEAERAARRLYRWAMGDAFKGKVVETTGNRYTWMRYGELRVNAEQGWKRMIHDLSHLFWRRANNNEFRPHDKGHAKLELRMIGEVIKRGWLSGGLLEPDRSPITEDDRLQRKLSTIALKIERWEAKERRAVNALKKLRRQQKYYERA